MRTIRDEQGSIELIFLTIAAVLLLLVAIPALTNIGTETENALEKIQNNLEEANNSGDNSNTTP